MTDQRVVPCALCGAEQRQDIAVLCLPCGTTLHGDLRAVRSLLGLLRDTTARLARIDRGTPSNNDDTRRTLDSRYPLTAAASPSPVDFGASDAGHAIEAAVAALCAALGPETTSGAPWFNPERPGTTQARAAVLADWAADRWILIRRADWAPTHARRLNQATRHAWALVDTPPETWFAGYCDTELTDPDRPDETTQCGWLLEPPFGAPIARCRGCGTHHDVTEARARMLASVSDVRVTLKTAARALTSPTRMVNESMLRGWKRLGYFDQLTEDDGHGGTRPAYDGPSKLFRLGDLIAADNKIRYGTTTTSTGKAS